MAPPLSPEQKGPTAPMKRQLTIPVCIPSNIKRVMNYISCDNPPTPRSMARRVRTSQASIFKITHKNLDQRKKKKVKVHHLTERMITRRKNRTLPFHNVYDHCEPSVLLTEEPLAEASVDVTPRHRDTIWGKTELSTVGILSNDCARHMSALPHFHRTLQRCSYDGRSHAPR